MKNLLFRNVLLLSALLISGAAMADTCTCTCVPDNNGGGMGGGSSGGDHYYQSFAEQVTSAKPAACALQKDLAKQKTPNAEKVEELIK